MFLRDTSGGTVVESVSGARKEGQAYVALGYR